jgi:hypothetical protein
MTTNRFGTPATWTDADTTDTRITAEDARDERYEAASLAEWGVAVPKSRRS